MYSLSNGSFFLQQPHLPSCLDLNASMASQPVLNLFALIHSMQTGALPDNLFSFLKYASYGSCLLQCLHGAFLFSSTVFGSPHLARHAFLALSVAQLLQYGYTPDDGCLDLGKSFNSFTSKHTGHSFVPSFVILPIQQPLWPFCSTGHC